MINRTSLGGLLGAGVLAAATLTDPASAAQQGPVDLTAPIKPAAQAPKAPVPVATPTAAPTGAAATSPIPQPVPQPIAIPAPPPLAHWTIPDAQALLAEIKGIGSEGLGPADYEPAKLASMLAKGESADLDTLASRLFVWLAEDLRDGRTPMPARVQWFAVDPDQDLHPNSQLLAQATETHDIPGVLASLTPTHPDYALLRDMLPKAKDPRQIAMIKANMDRWRWLARDMGLQYLIINVPEQELRLTVNNKVIRTYRAIVGKPGKTATPQLAEQVKNVVFNPTWTVPQSIVVGEGLGKRLIASPASARRQGYVATKAADGTITVVQQPGETNSLGRVKLDMPNE
ncbi:MAG: L,D-transpeptidase family protein, partial [Novosphingobium sp.]